LKRWKSGYSVCRALFGIVINGSIEFISDADLEKCSAKSVRKELEAELQVDLTEHKDKINEVINEAIVKRLSKEERDLKSPAYDQVASNGGGVRDEDLDDEELARRLQAEENKQGRKARRTAAGPAKIKGKRLARKEGTARKAPNNAFNKPFLLSEPLSRLLGGVAEMSRPQVVKHIWAYVKERNLQDPADKRIFVCDDLMLAVMKKPKITCFAMNKVLSDHLIKIEDTVAGSSPASKRAKTNEVVSDEDSQSSANSE